MQKREHAKHSLTPKVCSGSLALSLSHSLTFSLSVALCRSLSLSLALSRSLSLFLALSRSLSLSLALSRSLSLALSLSLSLSLFLSLSLSLSLSLFLSFCFLPCLKILSIQARVFATERRLCKTTLWGTPKESFLWRLCGFVLCLTPSHSVSLRFTPFHPSSSPPSFSI